MRYNIRKKQEGVFIMIKVMQYGEGNFLRTFVDAYFDTLNEEGGNYSVNIVKPITFGTLERFEKQNNQYHIVLRLQNFVLSIPLYASSMDDANEILNFHYLKKSFPYYSIF